MREDDGFELGFWWWDDVEWFNLRSLLEFLRIIIGSDVEGDRKILVKNDFKVFGLSNWYDVVVVS